MIRRDFAAEIASNKRKSVFLLTALPLLLAALCWVIGRAWTNTDWGAPVGAGIAIIASLAAYYSGGGLILSISGAREADPAHDQVLINVVDEMRIASGLPMPKVFVIETEAMNAFATGRDPQHAVVAATRGLINRLNREELQGVIAHELSHVANFDIRYSMLVAAMVGAIVLVSDGIRRSMFWGGGRRDSRERRGGGGAQGIFMIVALILAIVAPIFALLLQMSISRKRELLADSNGVKFTRNPLGLASALEKISSSPEPLPTANRATQHLYIVNPLKSFSDQSSALFSTHPPTEERIKILRSMAGADPTIS